MMGFTRGFFSLSNRVVQMSASLVVGLILGGLVGRWTAPSSATDPGLDKLTQQESLKPTLSEIADLASGMRDATGTEAGQKLEAMGEILGAVKATDLLDWGRAPENVSRRIINEMSDDELVTTITSITKITAEELGEISDLRDYANRLTHIAMSGVITPDISDTFGHESLEVEFSTTANKASGATDPSFEFDEEARRIYAVIPNSESAGETLMVHWYRVDQPENLLFDRYRVSPSDDYSYVWLKSPGRWTPGEYRVEFFSADEYLSPIASGTYNIRSD